MRLSSNGTTGFDSSPRELIYALLAGALGLCVTSIGCAPAPLSQSDQESVGRDGSSGIDEVPIQFYQGLAIIEGRIEGLDRPARFVIDSGAVTMIRRDLASQLAFDADPSVTELVLEDAMGSAVDAKPVLLRRLSVGRHTFRDLPAALVASDVFDRFCPPIDGVLGTGGSGRAPGFLDRVAVEIDRDAGRVRFASDGSLFGQRGITLPIRRYAIDGNGEKRADTRTRVTVVLEGQLLWAELDTGRSGLSSMTSDVFLRDFGRTMGGPGVREYIGDYGASAGRSSGTKQSWVASIRDVRLGRFRFESLPFRIVPPREDGLSLIVLGQNLLQQFNIVLDYPRGEMRVAPADSRPAPDVVPLELFWRVLNGKVVIAGLLADGVAKQRDVMLGDEIVKINDLAVKSEDPQSLCRETMRWLTAEEDLHLRLRRNSREYRVDLPRWEPWPGE